ncbi:hypothetical protein QJS10_CPB11g01590 [Acorus calamus]|uniref:carnosine N-methyltransferase n=1 Tax=Acorus calamus TaxID=4465 RepID=A0AAV9DSV1_ACOCL|nr:hypothetical protein QJS10_CPB11g01590 [Acorus calamus]
MERQHSKLEEALEIKSLRRIISAYLNYPDAAEEDVRRYERSYDKLSPAHKALLPHLPVKYQRLRRCISINSYFILNMLQAFEPPIDLSQDIDLDEYEINEDVPMDNLLLGSAPDSHENNVGSQQRASDSSRTAHEPEPVRCIVRRDATHHETGRNDAKEINVESSCGSGSSPLNSSFSHRSCSSDQMDAKVHDDHMLSGCDSCANGSVSSPPRDWLDPSLQYNVPLVDVDKVRCIIRNIVRDWAPEGKKERDQCYKPILDELDRLFYGRCEDSPPSCLVPGAGLGRLALDISCLDNDQLRPVTFPDIHPASAGITEGFSMCGGDFIEVYNDPCQEATWDAVVTCFFLDTAHNIVEYIEIISKILKDDGEMSIELSLEDVKKVAIHYGFELEMERPIETTYTANPRSMMQNRYYAVMWTMRKKTKS